MSDKDYSLVIIFEACKIVGAFLLEGGITDGEDFIKEQNIAASANSDGKGETDLHAGTIVLKFLVLKVFEFGELPDVVIHFVHFFVRKTEKGAVHVNIFATGEFGVKTDAELNKRN